MDSDFDRADHIRVIHPNRASCRRCQGTGTYRTTSWDCACGFRGGPHNRVDCGPVVEWVNIIVCDCPFGQCDEC